MTAELRSVGRYTLPTEGPLSPSLVQPTVLSSSTRGTHRVLFGGCGPLGG
jgi:hypothetical protein